MLWWLLILYITKGFYLKYVRVHTSNCFMPQAILHNLYTAIIYKNSFSVNTVILTSNMLSFKLIYKVRIVLHVSEWLNIITTIISKFLYWRIICLLRKHLKRQADRQTGRQKKRECPFPLFLVKQMRRWKTWVTKHERDSRKGQWREREMEKKKVGEVGSARLPVGPKFHLYNMS